MNACLVLRPAKCRVYVIALLTSSERVQMNMPNGRRIGRPRPRRTSRTKIWERGYAALPLKKLPDQGGETELSHDEIGAPDRADWTNSFLSANRDELERLAIATRIGVRDGRTHVVLTSSDRVGAIPIRSPITRKIIGGILVEPRFGWQSIGQVLGDVGFRVEPKIGGLALVPGSSPGQWSRALPRWLRG
jgi:hypothetical protein